MARTKRATPKPQKTVDGQKTRLPLAIKPSNPTIFISKKSTKTTDVNKIPAPSSATQGSTTETDADTTPTPPLITQNSTTEIDLNGTPTSVSVIQGSTTETNADATATSSLTTQASVSKKIPSSTEETTVYPHTTHTRKTKCKSKVEILNCNNNSQKSDMQIDEAADYDLQTCIEESGGIDQFLETPSMILYKRNLKSQVDLENFVLQHLSPYNANPCLFPGIKGTNGIKEKINDFYCRNQKQSMTATILFKGNTSKTTITQQILLRNRSLYLFVDGVMKNKTARKKIKRIHVGTQNVNDDKSGRNVHTMVQSGDIDKVKSSVDGDEISEEPTELNVPTGRTKRGLINWKGGSKNCGVYLMYDKKQEVKECVTNILNYGRDHGTLLTGVQLKTLLDIQNIEITKDRANGIAQLVSGSVDVVDNPHFMPPTAKRLVYEYYGKDYELSEVHPTKAIPMPSTILAKFKANSNKEEKACRDDESGHQKELCVQMIDEDESEACKNEESNEVMEVNDEKSNKENDTNSSDDEVVGEEEDEEIEKVSPEENNNDVQSDFEDDSGTVANTYVSCKEYIISENVLETCVYLQQSANNDYTENAIDGISKEAETQAIDVVTSSSPTVVGETNFSIDNDSNCRSASQDPASSVECPDVPSSPTRDLERTTTSSSPKLSLNTSISMNNQNSSTDILRSNSPQRPNRRTDFIEGVPRRKQRVIRGKAVINGRISSKDHNHKRRSFALRSKTKMKQQSTPLGITVKRKKDEQQAIASPSNIPPKNKKLNNGAKASVNYQILSKAVGKIPKKASQRTTYPNDI